jgi:hypothetical protein
VKAGDHPQTTPGSCEPAGSNLTTAAMVTGSFPFMGLGLYLLLALAFGGLGVSRFGSRKDVIIR